MEVDVQVRGAARMRRTLKRTRQSAAQGISDPAAREVAERLARQVRVSRRYRSRTGALRSSVRAARLRDGAEGWRVEVGGPRAPYARYLEFGTRHFRARRFFEAALRRSRADARRVMAAEARRGLSRTVRSVG